MGQDTIYLLIGGIVGFTSSTIGAVVDYLVSRKKKRTNQKRLPGCMLLITGALGFIGVIVTIAFYFLTGWIHPAVMTGIGVLGGFSLTFIIISMAWLFMNRRVQCVNVMDN